MNMKDAWTQLERVLGDIEGASDQLAAGAVDRKIFASEAILGIEFPESFRVSYQIHNGTEGHLFVVGPYRLWPLTFIVDENLRNKGNINDDAETLYEADDNGLIRGCIFSSGWTTFGDDGGASQLAIDFDPGAQGTAGQIIAINEDGTEHVADSFASFFTHIVEDIKSGTLEWNEVAGQYWQAD
jgi:cell wall assembly regulator SMI1